MYISLNTLYIIGLVVYCIIYWCTHRKDRSYYNPMLDKE